jgi:hypothetical protein
MKTFILTLSLLAATLCNGQSTDNYYWYFDKKIPIEMAHNDVLLISDNERSIEDAQKWISDNPIVKSVFGNYVLSFG